MNKKLDNRYKKIKELQEEIMKFEIDRGYIKIEEHLVQEYKNGEKSLEILSSEQVAKYILMPIREVEKRIPIDLDDYNGMYFRKDNDRDYNQSFYKYRGKICKIYREKAIEYMQILEGDRQLKTSKISIYIAILGVLVGLIAIIVSVLISSLYR